MVNFLLYSDIDESTIQFSNNTFTINETNISKYINETNNWYTMVCLEKGVLEEDIIFYDDVVDTEDKRYYSLVKLCEKHCLKNIFFSLWKQENDIYYLKYIKLEEEFNSLLSNLTVNNITGVVPGVVNTPNGFYVIKRYRGDE